MTVPAAVVLCVPLLLGTAGPAAGPVAGSSPVPSSAPAGHTGHGGTGLDAHGEGIRLDAAEPGAPAPGSGCDGRAPVRAYDVAAVAVDITLNRYLDHDPRGRMYVLEEDLARVRDEESRNAAARAGGGEPAVSVGLQGDPVQPLVLRVTPGECLRIRFRNGLPGDEAASVNVHGVPLRVAGTGAPAIGSEPGALAAPGQAVTYEWRVADDEPEGTRYFHSHASREREQAVHGLFGALIVEPKGSTWSDPRTGGPLRTGWDAMVSPPTRPAFRENAILYHEVGDETYQVLDRSGAFVPLVDPLTHAYRPGSRAMNYRSEPFLNRLSLQQRVTGVVDESLAYSSYAFGDPATPILRSYLGDPATQRLVHAGSEVFHVHHVHGGAIRWPRQPGMEPVSTDSGLDKHPPLRPAASERTDSQSVGPSETYDMVSECGSGGCQQSAGDFMVHCHVVHHYFAGMWGIWRVYNTLQDGAASTGALPPLLELPDHRGRIAPAVTSAALLGTIVDRAGQRVAVGPAELADIVAGQLPPPGIPRGYDASVLDWAREGDEYRGEPETAADWPGYRARGPGSRPPLLFDPVTGKLAYPSLRPHLAKRPPFAPFHGPAPFLDPVHAGPGPPGPGDNGPASVCPSGTRSRQLNIDAIAVPVPLNAGDNLVDPGGQLFVLREQEDAVRADPSARVPLVVRANAGEDCLDVLLRNELADTAETPLSKVSIHNHFTQFDVQGSDGVTMGFNYEQTVRPFRAAGEPLAEATVPGAIAVRLPGAGRFAPGATVGVGMDRDRELEFRRVVAVAGDVVTLDAPLAQPHGAGEVVSTEFVRYRWYPDAQVGTAYFHDHTNVLASGRHGLFGAVVVEPPGSTYHDPRTGAELASGPVADIHAHEPVSADIDGSFREFAMLIQDDNPLTAVGASSGSSLNLRADPPDGRGRDPSARFSAVERGDPATPVLEALPGDPVVVRTLVGAANDVHTWHLDGHWFRLEPWSATSVPTDTVTLGISERFDVSVPAAGGPQGLPGDYLYYAGRNGKLREGSWGVLRVHDGSFAGLQRLPGQLGLPSVAAPVCPPGAPRKAYDVVAVDVALPMLDGDPGKVFVLAADRDATVAGSRAPEPLVLHVNVGDCVEVQLSNATAGGPVSLHPDMLAFDPATSGGVAAGREPSQAVAPGATGTVTWFASPEVGPTVGLLRDWGDVLANPGLGLYGAVVVGPAGSTYRDPLTGADASAGASWQVDVHPPTGRPYRDFSLFLQDDDAGIGTHRMPYNRTVRGPVGINYRAAPVAGHEAGTPPATPTLEATAGDRLRINVLAPWSEQVQVFGIEGHRWTREPRPGSDLVSAVALGGTEARSLWLDAGGPAALPGAYRYGDERQPYREAGLWGVLRVHPACGPPDGLQPLDRMCAGGAGSLIDAAWVAALVAAVLVVRAGRSRWRGVRAGRAPR